MANFCTLFESMDFDRKNKEEMIEKKALEALSMGMNIDESMWDNFMMLINNADALGALLNVNPSKVADWRNRIKKYLNKLKENESIQYSQMSKKKKFVNSKDYKNFS